ncbi:decapping nuclease DXO homolog [Ostrinia nubilalis]|uniref:decapping nuclease DXO homolog n=1 Tax=Ostrinia nubilalis TaxID=29057 RepID=UPI00308264E3
MACLYNGSIYLCSLDTPKEIKRIQNRTKQEKIFCAWGYKFEQYLLSDLPGQLPDIDRPVIENEEFSLYYQSSLGKHQLLYGAQIDGLLATDKVPPPPDTNDFQTNLNYLRSNQYIELKTNREIRTPNQEQNFKKYKLLRCWCQCYLAGLKGLLVGFRDDKGIVRRLQCYNTDDIAAYCENEWQPEKALKYLDDFLTFIETSFKDKLEETKSNDQEPLHLQFDDYGNNSIRVIPQKYVNSQSAPHFTWNIC